MGTSGLPDVYTRSLRAAYLDIALVAGQYKIHCPVLAFHPPTQSGIYTFIEFCVGGSKGKSVLYFP